ncbi:hypothetical protein [Halomonas sp. WWR20]
MNGGLPHQFDRPKYSQRSVVERLFSWLKKKHRLCRRYGKRASSFRIMVTLTCIERCVRAGFQTERSNKRLSTAP